MRPTKISWSNLPISITARVYEKTEKVKVSGKFTALGLIAAGWTGWDFIPDLSYGFDPSLGMTSTASLIFDARPAPEFRVYGNVATSFNPLSEDYDQDITSPFFIPVTTTSSWSGFYVSELFCDYILYDFLYARLGKHTIGWGQGRIYNPGNLMSDSGVNYNLRFSLPSIAGLTIIVLTNGALTYTNLVYALRTDFVIWDTMISPAIRYNVGEGFNGLVSLKKVMFKTDFLVDVTANYYDSFLSADVLAGFFREWSDVKLYGEYTYSWSNDGAESHNAGLVLGFKKPFGAPFDFGAQVLHNFLDNSGTATLGISQKIWPFVTMYIAVPVVYGADDSYAVII